MTLKRSLYLIAIVSIAALLLNAHASPLTDFLSTYIPNSTISSASFYNQTVSSENYIVMQLTGSDRYVIINNSNGGFSLVTDVSTIQAVLAPFLTNKYYPSQSDLSNLNKTIHTSQQYSNANLTSCLIETGLNQQNTCTLANACFSCQTVPVCKKVLNAVGGTYTPFGLGVINFESNYTRLNNSYNSYFMLLNSITTGNAGTVIAGLSSSVSNITSISQVINNNPIFPPPIGSSFNTCPSGGNPLNAPWYCVAVGFCASIPFNTTALGNARGILSNLQSKIPSTPGIALISSNSSSIVQNYMSAEIQSRNGAAFNALIASISPKLSLLTNSSATLLAKYDNEVLRASLHALQNQFNIILSASVNQDIHLANLTLQSLIANATDSFRHANDSYNQVYGISQNNSAILLADQLSYQQVPSKLAMLASEQQSINTKLNSGIGSNDVGTLLPELQSIRVQAALFVAPLTIGYMIKTVDNPFVTAILGPSTQSVPQKMAGAPLLASMESLAIGILVLVVIFVITYFRIIRKGKLKNNKNARMTWIAVFVVVIALVIISTYATYSYASNANSFLPFNYFKNSLRASSDAYIALNGSAGSNSSIALCVSTLQGYLKNAGKVVQVIKINNYSCVSGSNISVLGLNCYNDLLKMNKPVIFISQSQSTNITYRGFYGTVLYASGNVTAGRYCTLGTLFKSV
jgi:hypothetical protein